MVTNEIRRPGKCRLKKNRCRSRRTASRHPPSRRNQTVLRVVPLLPAGNNHATLGRRGDLRYQLPFVRFRGGQKHKAPLETRVSRYATPNGRELSRSAEVRDAAVVAGSRAPGTGNSVRLPSRVRALLLTKRHASTSR